MEKESAKLLLREYITTNSLINHSHMVAIAMQAYAQKQNKDMRLTLETKKFPFAEYYGSLLDSVDLTNLSPQTIRTRGNFSIHGVTREIDVEGEITVEQNALYLKANWEIRLDDFDIVPPSLLIVKVDQIQKVSIDIRLEKQ